MEIHIIAEERLLLSIIWTFGKERWFFSRFPLERELLLGDKSFDSASS